MAVIKDSWLAKRCSDLFEMNSVEESEPLRAPSLTAEDLLRCKRRASLRLRNLAPLPARPMAWRFRAILHRAKDFQVLGEDVPLSDNKTSMGGQADMVLSHSGEKVLVRFWPGLGGKPTLLQVTDMVILMYASGIWSGLVIRYEGDKAAVDFVNPDRADAKKMIEGLHQMAKEIMISVRSSNTPNGEPGKHCDGCPFSSDCGQKAETAG